VTILPQPTLLPKTLIAYDDLVAILPTFLFIFRGLRTDYYVFYSPITFDGSFGVGSGTGLLSVYGWSTNPLVEYYIVEDTYNPPSWGNQKGSVTSDGSTYVIWENQRVNEPSIEGTSTFNQYISVRQSQRSSGTVTVENHFQAWANLGMDLGSLSYQVVAAEG
jgi:endo-1,4-beta-xylanase